MDTEHAIVVDYKSYNKSVKRKARKCFILDDISFEVPLIEIRQRCLVSRKEASVVSIWSDTPTPTHMACTRIGIS